MADGVYFDALYFDVPYFDGLFFNGAFSGGGGGGGGDGGSTGGGSGGGGGGTAPVRRRRFMGYSNEPDQYHPFADAAIEAEDEILSLHLHNLAIGVSSWEA